MPEPIRRREARVRRTRAFGLIGLITALSLWFPVSILAHSELRSSSPIDGAVIPAPFTGPIVLEFSEALAGGSKADLIGPGGSVIAPAVVDGDDPNWRDTRS